MLKFRFFCEPIAKWCEVAAEQVIEFIEPILLLLNVKTCVCRSLLFVLVVCSLLGSVVIASMMFSYCSVTSDVSEYSALPFLLGEAVSSSVYVSACCSFVRFGLLLSPWRASIPRWSVVQCNLWESRAFRCSDEGQSTLVSCFTGARRCSFGGRVALD